MPPYSGSRSCVHPVRFPGRHLGGNKDRRGRGGSRKEDQEEGISYGHMCLHTQDIYATRQELLEKGIDVTEIRKGSSQSLMCNIKDPDGNSIEISQLLPESLQFIHDHP